MKIKRNKYFYNPPLLIKKTFSDSVWDSSCGKIVLTFDDGPSTLTTEIILSVLQKRKASALFFCVGENLAKNKSLAKEILSEGHSIGNHTFSHSVLTKIKADEREKAVRKVQEFAAEQLNYKIKFFRPPHGKFPVNISKLLAPFGLRNTMWSLLTYDYQNNFNIVKFAIDNFLTQKSVAVFHDSKKSAGIIVDSLNYLFDTVEEKGYEFGKADECLK